jgi:hypothetical protein
MKRKTSSHIATGLTLALIFAAVALFYFEARDASRAGDTTPLYSVRRHDPYGTAALRDLLVETGVKVRNLERPRLERTDQGTLVQVLPLPKNPYSYDETQAQSSALLQWIADGNTVIQFTRWRTELMDLAGVPGEPLTHTVVITSPHFGPTTAPAHPTTAPNQPTTTAPAIGSRVGMHRPKVHPNADESKLQLDSLRAVEKHERAGLDPSTSPGVLYVGQSKDSDSPSSSPLPIDRPKRMALHAPWALPVKGPAGWTPIVVSPQPVGYRQGSSVHLQQSQSTASSITADDDDPRVLVGAMRIGQGRLIVVMSPSPALNHGITSHDNLPCILSMIGPGPVIFDEWSHGLGHGGTIVSFLREVGLTPLLLQIALVLALYSWSTRGHDRQDAPTAPRRRSVAEQVQTLGHLYAGTLPIDTAYAHVNDTVQMRMCTALRCSRADLNQRLSQLSPELRKSAQAIRAALVVAERSDFPACPSCGYDLTAHQASQCSECGASIPLSLRERIALTRADHSMHALKPEQNTTSSAPSTTVKPARRARAENQLARALTLSSEFVKEVARDRRSANSVTGNV